MGASNRPAFALPKSRHKPATDAMLETNVDGRIVYASPQFLHLVGYALHELLGQSVFHFIDPLHRAHCRRAFLHALASRTQAVVVFRVLHKDGGWRWLESTGGAFLTGDLRTSIVCIDVTEQIEREARYHDLETQYQRLFEHPVMGIALLTFERELVYANSAYYRLSGAVDHFLLANPRPLDALIGDELSQRFEHWYTDQGEWRCVAITLCPYRGAAGELESAILTVEDLTNFKSALATPSHTDELTGLPNRIEFERSLVEFWHTSAAEPAALRLALLDLDHFKNFNESLGHGIGDEALRGVARRLGASAGPRARVARFGRDTFAIAMFAPSPEGGDDLAAFVAGMLREPVTIQEKTYTLTASAGIASRGSATESADVLVRNAEIALNRAKLGGGNRIVHFEDGMHDDALKRFELVRDLRAALGTMQLFVLYQPVIDLSTGKLQGLEALARWQHPKYGEISPTEFIPLAEQMGMAADVGAFVFEVAMQQLKNWQGYKSLSMHVNVSASEIVELDVAARFIEVVDRVGIDPKTVVIEITESVILENNAHTHETLRRLRARGFRICIDDFGTGYSSLRYLTQFPIDAIKIDRSFVSNTREQLASEPIVKTLLKLAETFNIDVIAEGVESHTQDDALRSLGCLAGQGFLYDRPQSAEHLVKRYPLLRQN